MANYEKPREARGCIPHLFIFVELLQDSEAWEANIGGMQPLVSLVFPSLYPFSFWRNDFYTCRVKHRISDAVSLDVFFLQHV